MPSRREDWAELLERLLRGDRIAFLKWSRLVAGWLAGWRAYDCKDEWDDLVQEVLIAAMDGARQGRIREREATLAYVRQIARNKYSRRLSRHLDRKEGTTLPWEECMETMEVATDAEPAAPDLTLEMRRALSELPPPRGDLILAVYGYKRTVEQAAKDADIPLGTVKRHLRQGLEALRAKLGPEYENG